MPDTRITCDVVVIGSGIAGATAALELADRGFNVIVVTKADDPNESNTRYAQGGIIWKAQDDSPEILAQDIDLAGDEIGDLGAIKILAEEGPALVEKFLIRRLFIPFDKDKAGHIHLTAEAAHSKARIIHVGDKTGWEIQKALTREIFCHPGITVFTNHTALELISTVHNSEKRNAKAGPTKILGIYALNKKTGYVKTILAHRTIIAAGGIGALWLKNSNPEGARGDGIAMASRAGAQIIDMQYMQFHPTVFSKENAESFLISESVRGEGGVLYGKNKERFMFDFVPASSRPFTAETEEEAELWYAHKNDPGFRRPPELLPRDETTRAIAAYMQKEKIENVYLDFSPIAEKGINLKSRFPTIHEKCLAYGLDITKDLIPVAPGAHYLCGGIRVDEHGQTDLENCYAVGECSRTIHGANRLASTSLLDGLTFGFRAAKDIALYFSKEDFESWQIPDWDYGETSEFANPAKCAEIMNHLKKIMWEYAGVVRTGEGLLLARKKLGAMQNEIEDIYWRASPNDDLIGLRNAIQCALLVVIQARHDKINRGCHWREDGKEAE